MTWKNLKQTSLADALVSTHSALEELDDVHNLINWSRLENLLSQIHIKRRGEKAWPSLMMFKALLLQAWYGLEGCVFTSRLKRSARLIFAY